MVGATASAVIHNQYTVACFNQRNGDLSVGPHGNTVRKFGIAPNKNLQGIVRSDAVFGFEFSTYNILVEGIFSTLGQIFIASLKMLVVPLVFVSLICGTSTLSDPSKLGRLGAKSVGLYIVTTAIAITLAMSMALLFPPGESGNLSTDVVYQAKEARSNPL